MSDKDIVYLETRMDRLRGRWRAMSRTARVGIASMLFGFIGLITCWFLSFLPFLSIPFSMIGLGLGVVASATAFYLNRRRDAFWFPLIGVVISLMGLAIGVGNWTRHNQQTQQQQLQEARQASQAARAQLHGRWQRGDQGEQRSLEFTPAGTVLLVYNVAGDDDSSGRRVEFVGKYDVKQNALAIGFDADSVLGATRYDFDFVAGDQLLLRTSSRFTGTQDVSGRWQRVAAPPPPTAAQREIAAYRQQLKQFQSQHERIKSLLADFESQRSQMIENLKPYENGREKDDRWQVYARELNTLVNQIDLVKRHQPVLEQAMVRLEAAIANRTRKAEFESLGLSTKQLEEILYTADRLDDELKSAKVSELVEDLSLEKVVEQELQKDHSDDPPKPPDKKSP